MVDVTEYTYPFDRTGQAATNKVGPERHELTSVAWTDYNIVIPKFAPFFAGDSMKVKVYPGGRELIQGVDYVEGWYFDAASGEIGARIYGCLVFYDNEFDGEVEIEYQTLGGPWTLDGQGIIQLLASKLANPILTRWEQVVQLPFEFPPLDHEHDVDDLTQLQDLLDKLEEIRQAILSKTGASLDAHLADFNNPHKTNKGHVGLGNVPNFPMASLVDIAVATLNANRFMNPPLTYQMIQDVAITALNSHINNKNNPHGTNKSHVGLGLVDNFATAVPSDLVAGATATNKFVTPAHVEAMITAIALTALANHASDFSNPHRVSAGQVGAFTKQETLDAINAAVGGAGGTIDAATLEGSTKQQIIDDVLNQCSELINQSRDDIAAAVLQIVRNEPAMDSLAFGGQSPLEWEQKIADAAAGGSVSVFLEPVETIPAEGEVPEQHAGITYTRIANISLIWESKVKQADGVFMVTGGQGESSTTPTAVQVIVDRHDPRKSQVYTMGTAVPESEFFVLDMTADTPGDWEVWMKSPTRRQGVTLFFPNDEIVEPGDGLVQDTAPAGLVKLTVDGYAKESDFLDLLEGLTEAYDAASAILDA